jgi:hypothetical protein
VLGASGTDVGALAASGMALGASGMSVGEFVDAGIAVGASGIAVGALTSNRSTLGVAAAKQIMVNTRIIRPAFILSSRKNSIASDKLVQMLFF